MHRKIESEGALSAFSSVTFPNEQHGRELLVSLINNPRSHTANPLIEGCRVASHVMRQQVSMPCGSNLRGRLGLLQVRRCELPLSPFVLAFPQVYWDT
jgi:hypothetical protein